jgi:hypothetical protein
MTTTLALVMTVAVMVVWNVGVHFGGSRLLPVVGPLAAALL